MLGSYAFEENLCPIRSNDLWKLISKNHKFSVSLGRIFLGTFFFDTEVSSTDDFPFTVSRGKFINNDNELRKLVSDKDDVFVVRKDVPSTSSAAPPVASAPMPTQKEAVSTPKESSKPTKAAQSNDDDSDGTNYCFIPILCCEISRI
jgi:hypothetical protein